MGAKLNLGFHKLKKEEKFKTGEKFNYIMKG